MTLKCIAGIQTPDEGKIILNNRTLFDSDANINLSPQERRVGILFQDYALFPNMTLKENILIASNDVNKEQIASKYIKDFSLSGLENNYPHQLSGGQKQRCAIARMLINKPEILMFDEPFSALDEHLRWQMENELIDTLKNYDNSVLYVSHNKNEVYRICDNIAIVNNGRIVEHNDKINVFNNPRNVNSAIILGYKNISPINIVNDNIVSTKWNENFLVQGLDENSKYIGIREDKIKLKKSKYETNFKIKSISYNITNKTYILESKNNEILYVDSFNEFSNLLVNDNIDILVDPKDITLFY